MFDSAMMNEAMNWIRKSLKDEEMQAIALVMAWFEWSLRPELPIRLHAYYAAKRALKGRDLPGIQNRTKFEAYKLRKWVGGTMDGLKDPKPGPVKEAIWNEQWELLWESMNDRERAMADAFIDRVPGIEIAERYGISPGRVAQIRRELMRYLNE
jgi:DNA-directed RNA polymerase specialized sigma subunit